MRGENRQPPGRDRDEVDSILSGEEGWRVLIRLRGSITYVRTYVQRQFAFGLRLCHSNAYLLGFRLQALRLCSLSLSL